jgi:CheY-like chemotaxis protein
LTEATSVAEGIRRATTEHPDVILLDLVMPDGDGRSVLRAVRQQSDGHGIPVVIVTSLALSEEERTALLKEAQGVMSKADLTRETLAASVRAAVGQGPDERMTPLTHSVSS